MKRFLIAAVAFAAFVLPAFGQDKQDKLTTFDGDGKRTRQIIYGKDATTVISKDTWAELCDRMKVPENERELLWKTWQREAFDPANMLAQAGPAPVVKVEAKSKGKVFPNPAVKGGKVVLVPREQLRMKTGRMFHTLPQFERYKLKLPPPPTADLDWTMGQNLSIVPILGNDQYGDCYAAAACHSFSLLSANGAGSATKADVFDQPTLIKWYLQQSGGDNGLSDSDVYPAMEGGFIPPGGTHKILDYLILDPNNLPLMQQASQVFGPPLWTCSLLSDWLNNMGPNATWDATSQPDPSAGHAMVLGKIGVTGGTNPTHQTATWGYYNFLTHKGLLAAQPEVIFVFSLEFFNAQGYTPTGVYYTDAAAFWTASGGKQLPANPFPPPGPTPVPPTPVPPTPVPPTPVPPTPTPVPPTPVPLVPGTFVLTDTSGQTWTFQVTAPVSPGMQSVLDDLKRLQDDVNKLKAK